MILTGPEISRNVQDDKITISPFRENQINPNSYDVCLGDRLLIYTSPVIDPKIKNPCREVLLNKDGFLLEKKHYYVGNIAEIVGSDYYVPILHAKLRIAKLGLFVHVTANLIDIGNHCNFSLHLYPTMNILVFPEMPIAQISFWRVQGNIRLYDGKYKGVIGPAASVSYKHFKKKT